MKRLQKMSKLDNLLNEMLEQSGFDVIQEASVNKSYSTYLVAADKAFLNDAAKIIKKIAGGHAESINVVGRTVILLEYKGQDRSDIDLDFTCHLVSVNFPNVELFVSYESASKGSAFKKFNFTQGTLTPESVANVFKRYFG